MAPRPLTLIADSVKTFTGLVVEIEKKWAGDSNESGLWYRGHTEKTWELLPKFYREVENPTIRDEDDIREGFVIRAPHLTSEKPQNEWEWYFLMQHYGAPTRPLDWTDGALIALYFAVRDNPGYQDAAVWLLDPWEMNKSFHHLKEVVPPGSGSSMWDKDISGYIRGGRSRWYRGLRRSSRVPARTKASLARWKIWCRWNCGELPVGEILGFGGRTMERTWKRSRQNCEIFRYHAA